MLSLTTVTFWCREAFKTLLIYLFDVMKNLDRRFIRIAKNLLKSLCEYGPWGYLKNNVLSKLRSFRRRLWPLVSRLLP